MQNTELTSTLNGFADSFVATHVPNEVYEITWVNKQYLDIQYTK